MPESTPPEPLTQLAEGAAQAHELFLAYVGAGFTRQEALQLLVAILAAAFAASPRQEGA